MRRILGTLALAILAGTAVAATVENIIVRDGDFSYINGDSGKLSLEKFGDRYAAFELDGVRYVITDDATLDRIGEVIEPQVELGQKQAELGKKQAALGQKQASLGIEQAQLGLQQASAGSESRQRRLAEEQRQLAEKQRELGDKQQELGEQQRVLGERQRAAGDKAERELETIFRQAVRSGVARRR